MYTIQIRKTISFPICNKAKVYLCLQDYDFSYRPLSELQPKNLLTLTSPIEIGGAKDDINEKQMLYLTLKDEPYDQVMNIQHGKKLQRKISSDYVKIIEQTEQSRRNTANSLRSLEYAKSRPFLTVSQYQVKNQEYQKQLKENKSLSAISRQETLAIFTTK